MPNGFTTDIGLRLGPVLFGTLVKHYLEKRVKPDGNGTEAGPVSLKQEELLYHEVFNVARECLRLASHHTVEEVQDFGNARTPSPPWVHVVRVLVPILSCDEAATHLITAFGGEGVARPILGGVKWWQIRGIDGVDAQWITAKKDWKEAKRRYKARQQEKRSETSLSPDEKSEDTGKYEKDMDVMRCILYLHGGGYYFGSVDQVRYSIQRYARKINGRVFAINYRLAPQYPFPCALQDSLAAYLFLIRPPPGSAHQPVRPEHIVIAGDSAGAGLSLALLQIIRDSGLPMPAGGVLISPWCDFTHSFPSIDLNTETDVLPPWGLSFQKPSASWPPPSDEATQQFRTSLRTRLRETFRMDHKPGEVVEKMQAELAEPLATNHIVDVGATVPLSQLSSADGRNLSCVTASGGVLTINQQYHLYTPNRLTHHPLISSVHSYLGGLPPLLVLAGDAEVLRDEIIYIAHKAARPDKYPIEDEARALYPSLVGIEKKHPEPTKVHLQIYDEAPHVLPILFPFSTPAKYSFRAVATFCKFVTGIPVIPSSPVTHSPSKKLSFRISNRSSSSIKEHPVSEVILESTISPIKEDSQDSKASSPTRSSRALSERFYRASSFIRRGSRIGNGKAMGGLKTVSGNEATSPTSVSAPSESPTSDDCKMCTAGHPGVYGEQDQPWDGTMKRERVSVRGILRPLEPPEELTAFQMEAEQIGRISERMIRKFDGFSIVFDKKFTPTIKKVEDERKRHLKLARKDTQKSLALLRHSHLRENRVPKEESQDGLAVLSGHWAWILDEGEAPPPSSIAARRDTPEARRLARFADKAVLQEEHALSANRFWAAIINHFTFSSEAEPGNPKDDEPVKPPSKLSQIFRSDARAPVAATAA